MHLTKTLYQKIKPKNKKENQNHFKSRKEQHTITETSPQRFIPKRKVHFQSKQYFVNESIEISMSPSHDRSRLTGSFHSWASQKTPLNMQQSFSM